ncbi:MAG TPA: arginine deiminase-related protein [Chitinophagaceae bacterium]
MNFSSRILMVRPASFGFNLQTKADNTFQQDISRPGTLQLALAEFDNMVEQLRAAEIEVLVIEDSADIPKPDAVFPNNWFCTLPDGSLTVFPMYAANRRTEKRKEIIDLLLHRFRVNVISDWSSFEAHHSFLEGTGSMVFDHEYRIVYGCASERTSPLLLTRFAEQCGYEPVLFKATDEYGTPVYHTNVMMCIGHGFSLVCLDSIDVSDLAFFKQALEKGYKKLITITFGQMRRFAGNMLQLQNNQGKHLLVLSRSAFNALEPGQLAQLQEHTMLLPVDIPTIETIGGGSARCMMAELFLEPIVK